MQRCTVWLFEQSFKAFATIVLLFDCVEDNWRESLVLAFETDLVNLSTLYIKQSYFVIGVSSWSLSSHPAYWSFILHSKSLLDQCVCSHQKHYWQTSVFVSNVFFHKHPTMGITSAIGHEARFQVTTQAKIKDHLFMHWTREASSYDRLVCKTPFGKMLQSCSCMVAVAHFYATLHCVTIWAKFQSICNHCFIVWLCWRQLKRKFGGFRNRSCQTYRHYTYSNHIL